MAGFCGDGLNVGRGGGLGKLTDPAFDIGLYGSAGAGGKTGKGHNKGRLVGAELF
jgi:hypothetical protein